MEETLNTKILSVEVKQKIFHLLTFYQNKLELHKITSQGNMTHISETIQKVEKFRFSLWESPDFLSEDEILLRSCLLSLRIHLDTFLVQNPTSPLRQKYFDLKKDHSIILKEIR